MNTDQNRSQESGGRSRVWGLGDRRWGIGGTLITALLITVSLITDYSHAQPPAPPAPTLASTTEVETLEFVNQPMRNMVIQGGPRNIRLRHCIVDNVTFLGGPYTVRVERDVRIGKVRFNAEHTWEIVADQTPQVMPRVDFEITPDHELSDLKLSNPIRLNLSEGDRITSSVFSHPVVINFQGTNSTTKVSFKGVLYNGITFERDRVVRAAPYIATHRPQDPEL